MLFSRLDGARVPIILLASLVSSAANSSIFFATDIPEEQRRLMEADLETLTRVSLDRSDEKLKDLFRIPEISNDALQEWLESRVKYVVAKDFYVWDHLYKSPTEVIYPPIKLGVPLVKYLPPIPNTSTRSIMAMMKNVGGGIYSSGRSVNHAYLVSIPGLEKKVSVVSPRVGIVQVGEGLFAVRPKTSSLPVGSVVFSYYRMGILFHEARHSDGNGESLLFSHSSCPPGHDYEGHFACDFNLNGPYTIGAQFFKNLLTACRDCSKIEKSVLKVLVLDAASRIIRVAPRFTLEDSMKLTSRRKHVFSCYQKEELDQKHGPLKDGLCTEAALESSRSEIREIYKKGLANLLIPAPLVARVLDPAPEMLVAKEK